MDKPLDQMNKDELAAYAQAKFGYELDKRRRIDDLVEVVKNFERMKGKPKAEEQGKPKQKTPKTVRNRFTGVEWAWNPLYEGNSDLEVIEWE